MSCDEIDDFLEFHGYMSLSLRLYRSLRNEARFFDENLAARWFIHSGGLTADVSVSSILQPKKLSTAKSVKRQVREIFREPGNLEIAFSALRNLNLYREVFNSLHLKSSFEVFPGVSEKTTANLEPGDFLISAPTLDQTSQTFNIHFVTGVTEAKISAVEIHKGSRLVSRLPKNKKQLLHEETSAASREIAGVGFGLKKGVSISTGRIKQTKPVFEMSKVSLAHLIPLTISSPEVLREVVFADPRESPTWHRLVSSISKEFAELLRIPDEAQTALLQEVSDLEIVDDDWLLDEVAFDEEINK